MTAADAEQDRIPLSPEMEAFRARTDSVDKAAENVALSAPVDDELNDVGEKPQYIELDPDQKEKLMLNITDLDKKQLENIVADDEYPEIAVLKRVEEVLSNSLDKPRYTSTEADYSKAELTQRRPKNA